MHGGGAAGGVVPLCAARAAFARGHAGAHRRRFYAAGLAVVAAVAAVSAAVVVSPAAVSAGAVSAGVLSLGTLLLAAGTDGPATWLAAIGRSNTTVSAAALSATGAMLPCSLPAGRLIDPGVQCA